MNNIVVQGASALPPVMFGDLQPQLIIDISTMQKS